MAVRPRLDAAAPKGGRLLILRQKFCGCGRLATAGNVAWSGAAQSGLARRVRVGRVNCRSAAVPLTSGEVKLVNDILYVPPTRASIWWTLPVKPFGGSHLAMALGSMNAR